LTHADLERIDRVWPRRELLAEKTYRRNRCGGRGIPTIQEAPAVERQPDPPMVKWPKVAEAMPYALELWSDDDESPYHTLARAVELRLARGALAEKLYPGRPLMIRQGTAVQEKVNWPEKPAKEDDPPREMPETVKGQRTRRWKQSAFR
jgi:hypothetical protein